MLSLNLYWIVIFLNMTDFQRVLIYCISIELLKVIWLFYDKICWHIKLHAGILSIIKVGTCLGTGLSFIQFPPPLDAKMVSLFCMLFKVTIVQNWNRIPTIWIENKETRKATCSFWQAQEHQIKMQGTESLF